MPFTYEDIKKAVFYAQQKPEMLAGIISAIADALADTKSEGPPEGGDQ